MHRSWLAFGVLLSSASCGVSPGPPSPPPAQAWPELPPEGAVQIDVGGAGTDVHSVRMGFLSSVNADGITRGALGSSVLLTFVNSSSEERPVIVVSRYQRVLLQPQEGGLGLQSDGAVGGNLAPSAEATLRVTATGVGDPEEPGEVLDVHFSRGTARIDLWIVPLLGEWRGAGKNGEDLDLGMIAFHAALLRRGDEAQVLFYSPPRERRRDGSFKKRPFGNTKAGGYYWQLSQLDDVEIALWDIASGEVQKRPMGEPHNLFCSGHAHLPDGRLFVVGGHVGFFADNADRLHLFDANLTSGWWTRLAQEIPETRWYPTVTTLPDGKMLITSGRGSALLGNFLDEILGWYETPRKTYLIYDPGSGTLASDIFIDDDKLATYPTVVVLPGGSGNPGGVVFAQERNNARLFGYEGQGGGRLNSRTEPYRMATQGSRSYPYYGSGAILPFDADAGKFRVLIVGGQGERNPNHEDYSETQPATGTAEVFDFDSSLSLTAQTGWRSVPSMGQARLFPNTTVLVDGTVLVSGGSRRGWANCNSGDIFLSELFDPGSERFLLMAAARHGRRYHSTAMLLPDGSVLSAGSSGGFNLSNECIQPVFVAERYLPPYLWKGPRPTIERLAPGDIRYGASWTIEVDSAAPEGTRVALVRLASVTHGNDMDRRFVWLREEGREVLPGGTVRLTIAAPTHGTVAPPGDYMLFVLDGAGVPSLARMVRLADPKNLESYTPNVYYVVVDDSVVRR